MFERFTDRARRVIVLAQEEARGLNHNYIGTEHLLLGLLEPGGIAAQALDRFGMTATGTREEVKARVGVGSEPPKGRIPFTPRAKKVLELALREALQLSHNYIGTEHILLGLVREGEEGRVGGLEREALPGHADANVAPAPLLGRLVAGAGHVGVAERRPRLVQVDAQRGQGPGRGAVRIRQRGEQQVMRADRLPLGQPRGFGQPGVGRGRGHHPRRPAGLT